MDKALIQLSSFVEQTMEVEKISKAKTVRLMHQELKKHEVRIKLMQQLVIGHAEYDDHKQTSKN